MPKLPCPSIPFKKIEFLELYAVSHPVHSDIQLLHRLSGSRVAVSSPALPCVCHACFAFDPVLAQAIEHEEYDAEILEGFQVESPIA